MLDLEFSKFSNIENIKRNLQIRGIQYNNNDFGLCYQVRNIVYLYLYNYNKWEDFEICEDEPQGLGYIDTKNNLNYLVLEHFIIIGNTNEVKVYIRNSDSALLDEFTLSGVDCTVIRYQDTILLLSLEELSTKIIVQDTGRNIKVGKQVDLLLPYDDTFNTYMARCILSKEPDGTIIYTPNVHVVTRDLEITY